MIQTEIKAKAFDELVEYLDEAPKQGIPLEYLMGIVRGTLRRGKFECKWYADDSPWKIDEVSE